MTIESGNYISDFNAIYPESADAVGEVDDHIQLIKSWSKATFPNVAGAVSANHTELSTVDGLEQNLAVALTGKTGTGIATTGGTTAAFTLTTGLVLTSIVAGFRATFIMHASSGTAPTLTVDSVAAKNLVDKDGNTFATGDIPANAIIEVEYNGTSFQVVGGLQSNNTGTVTFSNYAIISAGSSTFTVPTGITVVQLRLIGPGGNGSLGTDNIAGTALTSSGPGGGSGAYGVVQIPVTPGQELACINGITGTASSVTDAVLGHVYSAGSGANGLADNSGAAGGVCSVSGSGAAPWIVNRSGSIGGYSDASPWYNGGAGAGAPGFTGNGNAGGRGGITTGAAGGDGSGGAAGGTAGTSSTVAGAGVDGDYIATRDVEGGGGGGLGIPDEPAPYDDGGDGGYPGGGGGGRCGINGAIGLGAAGHIVIEY